MTARSSGMFFGFNTTQAGTLQRLFDSVSAETIADGAVTNAKLATGAVTGGKITAATITYDKLAAMTSAQLAGIVSDETGSGALVFGTAPTLTNATLVTPALGTPTALVLTNATGLVNAGVDNAAAIAFSKLHVAAGTGFGAADAQTAMQTIWTYITNLNAWAVALATKLNADAGVTDTNYDTDPQT